jgi:uncharacterized Zn-binding protein involved in type VI secretion
MDFHSCPMVTVLVAHGGGPIIGPCAPTVPICQQPAARVTDMATCVGPPDAIVKGAFTTLISGLPAARVTDQTVHGGLIVVGCPTVIIGDAVGVLVVQRGNMFIIINPTTHMIYLVGVQEFSGTGASQAYADRASAEINNTWSGPTTVGGQPYTVVAMVQGRYNNGSSPANPLANQINVVQTSTPPNGPTGHRNTDPAYQTGTAGYQHSTEDADGGLTIAHEFGHTMGLPDEYTEGPRNPDGTRNITRTGPPGGLMGYINPGSRPTPGNWNSLVSGMGLH